MVGPEGMAARIVSVSDPDLSNSLTYYGEDLCSGHSVEVGALITNFTSENSPAVQRHWVQLDPVGAAAQFLPREQDQN